MEEIVRKLDDPEFVQTVPEMDGIAPVGNSEWNFHGGNLPEGNILADPEHTPKTLGRGRWWLLRHWNSTMGIVRSRRTLQKMENFTLFIIHTPTIIIDGIEVH